MMDMRNVIYIGGTWGVIVNATDLTVDDGLHVGNPERLALLDADPENPYMISAALLRRDNPDELDLRMPPFVVRAATFLDAQEAFLYVCAEMVKQAKAVLDDAFGIGNPFDDEEGK